MPLLKQFLLVMFCLALSPALAAPADNAVGMVLDLQGNAQVTDKGGTGKLQLLAYLKPQTRITLEAGSKASLSLYATRSTYQLTGPAVVDVSKDQLTVVQGNPPAIRSMSEKLVAAAETTSLAAGAYRMRSVAPRIVVVTPENGSILLDNRLAFSWVAAEAASYDIVLRDKEEKVLASVKVNENHWQLPTDVKLDPGNVYYWTVSYRSARDGKNHSASGEFTLASREEVAVLAELKPAASAPIEEWILYAAMLQGRRYLQEARNVWQFIAVQRPDLQRAQELAQ